MGVERIGRRRPVAVDGGLDQVGPVNSYGSTSGDLGDWGTAIITATATGLVYQLQTPAAGRELFISVDYTGATGNLTIANASTSTVFDGSTANVITVASSEEHLSILLRGLTTARWATISSTGSGISFAGSTVTS